jgi:hypothetical protein
VLERARPGALASIEERKQMSPIRSGSYESDGVAERRAQRVLNEKVGDRLPERRRWAQGLKWRPRTVESRRREPQA